MPLIAAHEGKLLTLDSNSPSPGQASAERSFSSGLTELDAIAPGGAFARGAVHELLAEPCDGKGIFVAMLLSSAASEETRRVRLGGRVSSDENTRNASAKPDPTGLPGGIPNSEFRIPNERIPELSRKHSFGFRHSDLPAVSEVQPFRISSFGFRNSSAIIWCDPARELYPPALASHGFPLDRLYLLRPKSPDPAGKDLIWAATECLRCKGVGAVVAAPPRLSRIEARRLQLAAERGGSVGILLRHVGRESDQHAAASRWLIRPSPGSRTIQRWTIQLLHGHGGRVGQTLGLELCRETNHLHTFDPMADRQVAKKPSFTQAS